MKGYLGKIFFLATCLVFLLAAGQGTGHAEPYIATGAVGYHTGPGGQYPRLGTLRPGQPVQVTRRYRGWLEIALRNGAKGYVPARFLRPANPGHTPAPPPGYRPAPPPGYAPPPASRAYYAAVAHSNSTKRYAISQNHPNKRAAQRAAIRSCGGGDCRIIGWVKNGCISIAANRHARAFSSYGSNPGEARGKTMRRCKGPGCRILDTVCTKR